jgi:hypothetical protein
MLYLWGKRQRRAKETVRETPPPPPDLYSLPLFAENLAAYLRRNGARWRLRRTDEYLPRDWHLAERTVHLVGRIDRELLLDFFAVHGSRFGLTPPTLAQVRKFTCLIPVDSHPKRLLLAPTQTLNGAPLPSLHRYDDSRILSRDLLDMLRARQFHESAAHPKIPRLDDSETLRRIRLLLAATFFSDPARLSERLREWLKKRDQTNKLFVGGGIVDTELLLAWIRCEGDEFAPKLGGHLADQLRPFVTDYTNPAKPPNSRPDRYYLDSAWRPGDLQLFPTIDSLLLHGVQDVLKLTIETAHSRSRRNTPLVRERLMRNPRELAGEVRKTYEAVETLSLLLRNQSDRTVLNDLGRYLTNWVSYAAVPVEVGVPFSISWSNITVLRAARQGSIVERFRRRLFTRHLYPIAFKDALSVHVEIKIDDPEIDAGQRRVVQIKQGRPDSLSKKPEPVNTVFGHKLEPTRRLVHRYSSKRPIEGVQSDEDRFDALFLQTRIRIAPNVFLGYVLASVVFMAAGGFDTIVAVKALIDGSTESLVTPAVETAALASALALWMITTQYRVPLIAGKLIPARWVFAIAIIFMVVPLSIYGLVRTFNPPKHNISGTPTTNTTTTATTTTATITAPATTGRRRVPPPTPTQTTH